uniref:Uncharacterized protein n=1 Tax=Neobodo designis TaxID=312471 RepID=A0A7S1Q492_NEODS|mmetsp:Transcript_29564/g.91326  ORF Transcript_29564/g.91326 Transcript_29564/m.91326 type:complete len:301 (+) Transcript_29564:43-945(+)
MSPTHLPTLRSVAATAVALALLSCATVSVNASGHEAVAMPPPARASSSLGDADLTHPCHNATGACRAGGLYRCLTTRSQRLALNDAEELAINASEHQWRRHKQLGHASTIGFVDDDDAEHVPWSSRCDGVADCADGTDELMCNVLPWPPSHPGYHTATGDDDSHGLDFDDADGTAYHRHRRERVRADRGRVMHPQFSESTCIGCTCFFGELTLTAATNPADTHPWFDFALAARPELVLVDACPNGRGCNPANTRQLKIHLYKKYRLCRMAVCCVRQFNCIGCLGRTPGATAAKKCWGDAC